LPNSIILAKHSRSKYLYSLTLRFTSPNFGRILPGIPYRYNVNREKRFEFEEFNFPEKIGLFDAFWKNSKTIPHKSSAGRAVARYHLGRRFLFLVSCFLFLVSLCPSW
jgi:hypothetical protein